MLGGGGGASPGNTGNVIGGRIPGAGVITVVVGCVDGDVVDSSGGVVVSVGSVVSVVVGVCVVVGVGRRVVVGYWVTSVRGTQVYAGSGTNPGGTTTGGGAGGGA